MESCRAAVVHDRLKPAKNQALAVKGHEGVFRVKLPPHQENSHGERRPDRFFFGVTPETAQGSL